MILTELQAEAREELDNKWYLHTKQSTYDAGKYSFVTVEEEVKSFLDSFIASAFTAGEKAGREAAVDYIRNAMSKTQGIDEKVWNLVLEFALKAGTSDRV